MKRFFALIALMLSVCFAFCSCSSGAPDGTPSLADGEVLVNNLIITLPSGYELKTTGGIKVACCEEYPEKVNNISFVTGAKDSPDNYTKEKLDEIFSNLVAGFSGSDTFQNIEISGCKVLVYSYTLVQDEKPLIAMQYMIFGSDFTDTVTVTLESADDLAAIEQSIKSARIK